MIKIKVGEIEAYKATAMETTLIGGFGVCDTCNDYADKGYLVPVLNRYLCDDCFKSFCTRHRYRKLTNAEMHYMRIVEKQYESAIRLNQDK